jgi:predicted GIY-YIG superfamily endonuclease
VSCCYEHHTKAPPGFSCRGSIDQLVWLEIYDDILGAIAREKQLKNWRRVWKIKLTRRRIQIGTASPPVFHIEARGYKFRARASRAPE